MFQIVKYNLLIPFLYDSEQQYKLFEDRIASSKEDIKECIEKGVREVTENRIAEA